MLKDIQLLSEIYSLINEDPDTFDSPAGQLHWKDNNSVSFFTWNNQVVLDKKFSGAHNELFAKAIINSYFGLPLNASKKEISAITTEPNWQPNNPFINDLISNGCILKVENLETMLSPLYRAHKLKFLTLLEFWVDCVKILLEPDLGKVNYLNVLKMRGHLTPCGRAWIKPDAVYVSLWPSKGQAKITPQSKELVQTALNNLIKQYPAAFKMQPNYTFVFEQDEEKFDLAKAHTEVDPTKRKNIMLGKGIKHGSSKEAQKAKRAGFETPAQYKGVRRQGLGDSFKME